MNSDVAMSSDESNVRHRIGLDFMFKSKKYIYVKLKSTANKKEHSGILRIVLFYFMQNARRISVSSLLDVACCKDSSVKYI